MWDNIGEWEADSSYNAPNVPEVAQTSVLQGTGAAPVGSDQWTGFFQDALKGVLGYATAKDAAQTRAELQQPAQQARYRQTGAPAMQQGGNGGLLLLVLGGALIFVLAKD